MLYNNTFEVVSCSKPNSEIFADKQFTHLNNLINLYPEGLKEKIHCSSLMLISDMGEFKIGDRVRINIEKI